MVFRRRYGGPGARHTTGMRGTDRRSSGRRRYGSSMRYARVRFQKPSAHNQRRQIMANTRAVEKLQTRTRKHLVYTDYKLSSEINPTWNTWFSYALTQPSLWLPVLREDQTVQRSSHTFVRRMQLNMRAWLGPVTDETVYFNIFIVSPRWQSPQVQVPTTIDQDFIQGGVGFNCRLNPARFKVHASKYITLTVPSAGSSGAGPTVAGNPFTTYRKWQWNIDLKFPITQPTQTGLPVTNSWKDKDIVDLPFYNRYYLLVYTAHEGVAGVGFPTVSWDALFTCVNSD